jgi:hypothetical protein
MIRSSVRSALWMIPSVVLLGALVLLGLRFSSREDAAARAAFQAARSALVSQTRLALASASEAEKSAVLAVTDEDSQRYADQARVATAQAESARKELLELLTRGGTARERELVGQFSQQFADFQRIDSELLALAVKNTNVKAYALAFGPAAQSIDEMSAALSRVVAKSAAWSDSRNVAVLAFGAQTAALRIQVLLSPHIAEESDKKMDELEAKMGEDARRAEDNLDALTALAKLHGDPELVRAVSAYSRFKAARMEVLALSRENTNVRSLGISLTQKRRAMSMCEESLSALEQAIRDEPPPATRPDSPVRPR